MLRRAVAIVAVFAGAALVGFDPNRWDIVILDLPRGSHGIHLHDVIGMAFITLGVVVLWRSGRSGRSGELRELPISPWVELALLDPHATGCIHVRGGRTCDLTGVALEGWPTTREPRGENFVFWRGQQEVITPVPRSMTLKGRAAA